MWTRAKLKLITWLYAAFAQDPKIPAGPSRSLDSRCQVVDVPATAQLLAGLAGLRNLHQRSARVAAFEKAADAYLRFQCAGRRQILAKRFFGEY